MEAARGRNSEAPEGLSVEGLVTPARAGHVAKPSFSRWEASFPRWKALAGRDNEGKGKLGRNYPIDDISDVTGAFPVAWGWG